jgi:arylformamidase
MNWIDISVPLENGMVHWPGDAPYQRTETLHIANGDVCNLSQLSTSVHTGTHMDAPRHFLDGAPGIDAMPITATVGECRVIAIQDPAVIPIHELEPHHLQPGERILFRTRNSDRPWSMRPFHEAFVHLPPDTAAYLAQRKIQTVGVDYLSVGGFPDHAGGPETHRTLLAAGIWIIEGLNLTHVSPGRYDLICLPLKLAGADGAPARAILRQCSTPPHSPPQSPSPR